MYSEKICALRTEISKEIESVVKRELATDAFLMVFDDSVYLFDGITNTELCVNGIMLSKDGSEVILLQEDEELGTLTDVCLDTLADIADVLERGDYEVEEW